MSEKKIAFIALFLLALYMVSCLMAITFICQWWAMPLAIIATAALVGGVFYLCWKTNLFIDLYKQSKDLWKD